MVKNHVNSVNVEVVKETSASCSRNTGGKLQNAFWAVELLFQMGSVELLHFMVIRVSRFVVGSSVW